MANKKPKVGGSSDMHLPTKKVKGEKKPKTGGKKKGNESIVETPELAAQEEQALPLEPTETPNVATTTERAGDEPTTANDTLTTHDVAGSTEEPDISLPQLMNPLRMAS